MTDSAESRRRHVTPPAMSRKRPSKPRRKPQTPERTSSDVFSVTAVTVHLERRDILCMMAEALASGLSGNEQEDRARSRAAAARWWTTRRELKDWLREQVRNDPRAPESAEWMEHGGPSGLLLGVSDHLARLFPEWNDPRRPTPDKEDQPE